MRRFTLIKKLCHFDAWIVLCLALSLTAKTAHAYQEDTHFIMTFILCNSAGFTREESLIIASVDQGMDDSPGTVANGGTIGVIPNMNEEWLWHALDMEGKMHTSGILHRKQELFNLALQQTDLRTKLIFLGVFFHYQQDTWAHRYHLDSNHLSMYNYTTYFTPLGHAKDVHQPDRPPFDPVCALMCLEDGVQYACDFLRRGLGREPNSFLTGYIPMGGTVNDQWNDNRKGKYFNQLDLRVFDTDTTSARCYLNRLIHAQVDEYTVAMLPPFITRYTSDQADFNTMRTGLQKICDAFAAFTGPMNIPTQEEKMAQGYAGMNTVNLFALNNYATMITGEFRIKTKASGRYLSKDGDGDKLITTKDQATDDYTVFILEHQIDGTYRIKVKADNIYLQVDGCDPGHCLNTKLTAEADDPFTKFILENQLETNHYKIRVKANGRYLGETGNDNRIVSTVIQPKNDLTKFVLEKK